MVGLNEKMATLPGFDGEKHSIRVASPLSYVRHITLLVLSTNWRRTLHPRNLFAWKDDDEGDGPRRLSSTAWLDGLRGCAALQVFLNHFGGLYMDLEDVYGTRPEATYLFQFPLFRPIFCAANSAVCIFFVISGYVLSYRFYHLIREQRREDLYTGLSSSFFRRPIRLFLPVILTTFPNTLLFQYGWWPGWYKPGHKESLFKEWGYFFGLVDKWINPWPLINKDGIDFDFSYAPQAWTIPLELHCSMVTYVTLMIIAPISSWRLRSAVVGFAAFYSMHFGAWWICDFMLGMLIADWNVEQKFRAASTSARRDAATIDDDLTDDHTPSNRLIFGQKPSRVFYILLFCLAYYIVGIPAPVIFSDPPLYRVGYEWIYKFYPPNWIFQVMWPQRLAHTFSASMLVISISQVGSLQAIFTSKFCQWLGKLSFALYLAHTTAIWVCTGPARLLFGLFSDADGGVVRYIFEFCCTAPVAFMWAGVIERYFDRNSIRLSKWMEQLFYGAKKRQPQRTEPRTS